MPSREEIAGWLRQAGKMSLPIGHSDSVMNQVWISRAAKVENMRYENCEYAPDDISICETDEPIWECSRVDGTHSKDFGCWYFEQNVK